MTTKAPAETPPQPAGERATIGVELPGLDDNGGFESGGFPEPPEVGCATGGVEEIEEVEENGTPASVVGRKDGEPSEGTVPGGVGRLRLLNEGPEFVREPGGSASKNVKHPA
ncbi:hypothetical protein M427DRAFT_39373 [Gonapodya prolifera JEL478]|uniref:Uncharacterized protein n=1 Tax=Gonapodya prolifera (strain JEL478) TaxID=1344416 RepID=A0A138ZXG1_GONPJ|nr:hypothetical protein M427DRAFT_39373 [Gonapodya prolifera JEL478]|eukprot:KXS09196.1 hypothetical protein M427DRAFT_39373 [Gonapodya prolifera JEL478]